MTNDNDHPPAPEIPEFRVEDEREITVPDRVALRPNWNADGQSIVFEVKQGALSQL